MRNVVSYLHNLSTKRFVLLVAAVILCYQPAGNVLATIIQGRTSLVWTIMIGTFVQVVLAMVFVLLCCVIVYYFLKLVRKTGINHE